MIYNRFQEEHKINYADSYETPIKYIQNYGKFKDETNSTKIKSWTKIHT